MVIPVHHILESPVPRPGLRPDGIRLLNITAPVASLVSELRENPQLWNDFDLRTNHPQSPHRELSDIFVRYNARENFTGDRQAFNGPHIPVWWPAVNQLPSARKIAMQLMRELDGDELGMVLVTKIPAHTQCYPHTDSGWHAGHFDKFAVQLASAPGQKFVVDDVELDAQPGECYFFDNSRKHWVINDSDEDRMTLIVCIRNRFTGERKCL